MNPVQHLSQSEEQQSELLQICESLRSAAARVDPQHPVVQRLAAVIGPDNPDTEWMRDAIDTFYSLPLDEQRTLLGGWRPCRQRPERATIQREAQCGSLVRTLEVEARPDGWTRSEQTYVLECSSAPVVVRVAEGTSRADAIQAILNAAMALVRDFDAMVDQMPIEDYRPEGSE